MGAHTPAPNRPPASASDDRLRLIGELHDVVAHRVSAMVVQAAAARRTLDDPPRASDAILAVEETGRRALVELRRLLALVEAERGARSTASLEP